MTPEENNRIINLYIQEIQNIYPTFEFAYAHGSEIDGNLHSSQLEFFLRQKSLNGLDYDINQHSEFIHYTSLEAFFEILNTQSIRLYDLNNMNDPFEFNAAIKELNMPFGDTQIELFKRSLFVTSLCFFNESVKDNFDMWRLYGKNGNGVGIVFEILNPQDNWFNFLIAKVQYGYNSLSSKNLLKAIAVTDEYIKNKGMMLDRIPQLLAMLLMFHKNEIWQIENEYRLCTYLEYDPFFLTTEYYFNQIIEDKLIFFLNNNGKQIAYVSYPIESKLNYECSLKFPKTEEYEKAIKTLPSLKIKKVIGGYSLSEKMMDELRVFIVKFGSNKLRRFIDFQPSHLTKWFR